MTDLSSIIQGTSSSSMLWNYSSWTPRRESARRIIDSAGQLRTFRFRLLVLWFSMLTSGQLALSPQIDHVIPSPSLGITATPPLSSTFPPPCPVPHPTKSQRSSAPPLPTSAPTFTSSPGVSNSFPPPNPRPPSPHQHHQQETPSRNFESPSSGSGPSAAPSLLHISSKSLLSFLLSSHS